MSWSVTFFGNPENISKALDAESERLDGASKHEFDAALPHLKGLVGQNYNKHQAPVVKLSASGHGYFVDGQPDYTYCTVSIENMGGAVV